LQHEESSQTQTSANQFNALFDGKRGSDNPKPVDNVRRLIGYLSSPDEIVCDFFAGSGTDAHGAFLQNIADKGKRSFVSVQLSDTLDPEKIKKSLLTFAPNSAISPN
jgi:adenine-specific DNA-methyltransferase